MSAQTGKPAAFLVGAEKEVLIDTTILVRYWNQATAAGDFLWALADASATPSSFSYPSPPAVERRSVAERFAAEAKTVPGVKEVWLDGTVPDLRVSVVMGDLDFENELKLRGVFIQMACESLDPGEGELSVYFETEDVPPSVRQGLRLA